MIKVELPNIPSDGTTSMLVRCDGLDFFTDESGGEYVSNPRIRRCAWETDVLPARNGDFEHDTSLLEALPSVLAPWELLNRHEGRAGRPDQFVESIKEGPHLLENPACVFDGFNVKQSHQKPKEPT